uniref:Uncharacterized protein n=1 Tax=Ciona intestinalis TaxID=7719 RepID=H2XLS6_CIOIN
MNTRNIKDVSPTIHNWKLQVVERRFHQLEVLQEDGYFYGYQLKEGTHSSNHQFSSSSL